ncbi:MAG: oxidoreductase [marine bacterium B5-7]|nr:MAG: oxidoreductase [marine bacterium B5-7]
MDNPQLNVALIGCGRIAVRHAEIIGRRQIHGMQLKAVCDIDKKKADAFAEKYNVDSFADMDQMMQESDIDVAVVLTPSGLHAEHTLRLVQHAKYIVVEKPMALTVKDADSMISACDEHGVRLFVVKQNRFNLPVIRLREALQAGRFGKLVMGTIRVRWCRTQEYYDQDAWRGTWAMDGGVITNQASHHIDLLNWMLGDVSSVFARSSTALVDIETEDTAVALIKFENDALGVIEATTATRPYDLEGSLSILGEKGTVEIGGFAVNRILNWQFYDETPEDDVTRQEYSENPPDVYGFGHKRFYEHVADCISTGNKQLVDGLEGRKSVELVNAIYQSIETNAEVGLKYSPRITRLGN